MVFRPAAPNAGQTVRQRDPARVETANYDEGETQHDHQHPKPSRPSTRSAPRTFGNPSTDACSASTRSDARTTRSDTNNAGDGNTERNTGTPTPTRRRGDEQILTSRLAERRSGNKSRDSPDVLPALDPLPEAVRISPSVCEYLRCSVSLAGRDARARFCCRAHKDAERKRRQRAEKSAGKEIYWLCDDCGKLYLGRPPTCPSHTQSPMKGTKS